MNYEKNYNKWNDLMKHVESCPAPFFKEREIWWAIIGINIGHEENGKGEHFKRPVIILKKLNRFMFIGIPLSSTSKTGNAFITVEHNGRTSTALLEQIKTMDSRRLTQKFGVVNSLTFDKIKKAIKDLL